MSGGQDRGEASSSNKAPPTEHQAHPERLPLHEPQNGSRPLTEALFKENPIDAQTVKFTDALGSQSYIPLADISTWEVSIASTTMHLDCN